MASSLFGPGNSAMTANEISQFLAGNPNILPDQIVSAANANGLSLAQIQAAMPNDARFSNQVALPYLAGLGITPPVATTTTPVAGAPQTGLIGSEAALESGLNGAVNLLSQGNTAARADINAGLADLNARIASGASALEPFVNRGGQAFDLQMALSGALGPDAQRTAFANYNDSPGQDFLRQRGEQAVLRNASAVGGLGGSRVLQELQRQGVGLAQQDFSNQFDRLGQLSGMGLNSAGMKANMIMSGANIAGNLTGQMANNSVNFGNNAANFTFNTGQNLSSGRTRAGEMLANLNSQQGAGVADIIRTNSSNIAQLLAGSGTDNAAARMQLAQLLSALGMTQSGQVASLPGVPGIQQTSGILEGIGQFASGLGGAISGFNALRGG